VIRPFILALINPDWETLDLEKNMIANYSSEEQPIELVVVESSDKEEIKEAVANADALLTGLTEIDKEIISSAPNLKVISKYGIGVNNIDIKTATSLGIMVANVNEYCVDEVSDHALAFIMAAARRLIPHYNFTREGKWNFNLVNMPIRASEAVVGLLGYGRIPKRLAKKLKAIGYNVLAYDPFVSVEKMAMDGVEKADLLQLLENSDFVSVHTPLTKDTYHLISKKEFELMKETAFIINTSRGPIIDEAALIEAIQENSIAGAYLDVTEEEPPSKDHILRQLDKVVLTPHAAFGSEAATKEMRQKGLMNIIEVSQGKAPTYLINREVLKESDVQPV
jgi:D-3-phosphoglycerate dehydrogenase